MNDVRLFFAGDFCSKPSASLIAVSDELKCLIQSCDLKTINFEVPLKPVVSLPPQQYERFWQNDDVPGFLRGIGFNLFSIANNHTFDWGEKGFRKTKEILGDQAFGAGTYQEAYEVKICGVSGLKIGFLALSYAAYTGVFDDVMNHNGLGCAYINDLHVNHIIVEAKKNVDYLFVLPHDGIEYIDVPMPETIARYRDFIDWGADGVIGAHPHCPQGWEEYKGKPIFYSLGNFFFNSKVTTEFRADKPHWYEGLCAKLTISNGKVTWEVVNVRNTCNVGIEIDCRAERETHNEYLNELLRNHEKYEGAIRLECKRLAETQELPIIDRTQHPTSLRKEVRNSLKTWLKIIRKQKVSDDFSVKTMLRNDTRRGVLLRGMDLE